MSGLPLAVTLGAAVLASAAALAAVLAASRAAARHARAEDRQLRAFGEALTQAAHELATLASAQTASVQHAHAHTAAAAAAAAKATGLVADAEARLNRCAQRAEQGLATAGESLQRAQDTLAPFTGLAQDLPGAIGTAIRDAAQSGAQETAAAIAANITKADQAWDRVAAASETLQHATHALRQQTSDTEGSTTQAGALAQEAQAAIAALRQERAALAADRRQNEHIAALLLRLGKQAEAVPRQQPQPATDSNALIAQFTANLDHHFQPHFAAMGVLDERLNAAAQALNNIVLGAVRHELAATAADRAFRAQAEATSETIRALGHTAESHIEALGTEMARQLSAAVALESVQHALRFMENALGHVAHAAPAQEQANQRVLQATQDVHAVMEQENTQKKASTSF